MRTIAVILVAAVAAGCQPTWEEQVRGFAQAEIGRPTRDVEVKRVGPETWSVHGRLDPAIEPWDSADWVVIVSLKADHVWTRGGSKDPPAEKGGD